ncbi:MAG TPA: alanine--tRNA ligase-related protein, partial [Acidimicrobiales bacterium]|nr:alanine--tRNA ligase-related protein [Acidimicrobiales bacterium]
IRRAALRAQQLGASEIVLPDLAEATVATLGSAYPRLERDISFIETVVAHEEEAFRRTLRAGSQLIETELAKSGGVLAGEVAFKLHDTYGFPIDLTVEVAAERGVEVDRAGFDQAMDAQRRRGRADAHRATSADSDGGKWRGVFAANGPTEFVGYSDVAVEARILAIEPRGDAATFVNVDGGRPPQGAVLVDVVLDRTPFYAEGGGQVGDTGTIRTPRGVLRVLDTTSSDGVTVHTGYVEEGEVQQGEPAVAAIDVDRREAIRRNHTATHLLHSALRTVLGEHVKQQGSLVAPDHLRFDFSHFAAVTKDELERIEQIVSSAILENVPVNVFETSRTEAENLGAIAFFGEKYGEVVRVVEASPDSVELCGGTHVSALGSIGPFRILSESSIGANTRRIEATTGTRSIEEIRQMTAILDRAASALHTAPNEVPEAVDRLVEREHSLEDELKRLRAMSLKDEAKELASLSDDGRLVARRDGVDPATLRELALAVRSSGVGTVALIGAVDDERVAIVVASTKESGIDAREVASRAARLVGGGGGGSPELATAGGRDVAAIESALVELSSSLGGN